MTDPIDLTDVELVDALCAIESGLSEWEVDFAESLARQVKDESRSLSERQRRKGESILQRVGGG